MGIAVVDIYGKILDVRTLKQPTDMKIIDIISSHGKPIIIATDVSKVPSKVQKIASSLGVNVFSPATNIKEVEKEEVRKIFNVKSDHERDALSAALYAYKHMKPKIDSILKKLKSSEFHEYILERVLSGEQLVRTIISSFNEPVKHQNRKERKKQSETERKLIERIKQLEKTIEKLKNYEKLYEECKRRKHSPDPVYLDIKLKSEVERYKELVKDLSEEVDSLKKELEKYRSIIKTIERHLKEGKKLVYGENVKGTYITERIAVVEDVDNVLSFLEELHKYRKERMKDVLDI